jgi:glyoxylase I family protein
MLQSIHHIAIICSDYPKSKHFYTQILGLQVIREVYRAERDSYKLDLALHGQYITDKYTGKRFTFFADPDDLPIELYEG